MVSHSSQTQRKLSVQLAEAAQKLVGTRFMRQGRTLLGVDCVGLLIVAAREIGVNLSQYDNRTYSHNPDPKDLKQRLDAGLQPATEIGVGSVLLLNGQAGTQHIAIVAECAMGLTVVHASNLRGCVIEHRMTKSFRETVAAIYTLKGEAV